MPKLAKERQSQVLFQVWLGGFTPLTLRHHGVNIGRVERRGLVQVQRHELNVFHLWRILERSKDEKNGHVMKVEGDCWNTEIIFRQESQPSVSHRVATFGRGEVPCSPRAKCVNAHEARPGSKASEIVFRLPGGLISKRPDPELMDG